MNAFQSAELTMTPQEAEEVVRRHLELVPPTGGPTLEEVAEVLRISPEQVALILADVRSRPIPKRRRRATPRERRVWLLSGIVALAVAIPAYGGLLWRMNHGAPIFASAVPYELRINDAPLGTVANRDNVLAPSFLSNIERVISNSGDRMGQRIHQVDSIAEEARRAAAEGNWENIPGVRMSFIELRKFKDGRSMRWARASAPIYLGDDLLVANAVAKERAKRIEAAIREASTGLAPPTK